MTGPDNSAESENDVLEPRAESEASKAAPLLVVTGPPSNELESLSAIFTGWPSDRISSLDARLSEQCSIAMLEALGGNLDQPPDIAHSSSVALDKAHALARECLSSCPADQPVVLAHASVSLVAPLWSTACSRSLVGVLVLPSPEQAGEQASARDQGLVEGIAVYERYLRRSAYGFEGASVYVLSIEEAEKRPEQTRSDLLAFLTNHGIALDEGHLSAFSSVFSSRDTARSSTHSSVLEEIDALYRQLSALAGACACFSPAIDPHDSAWTTEILRLRDDLDQVTQGLLWATHQLEPIVRFTPPRITGPKVEHEDEADETTEPSEDGPYPLSASEDRRGYHRWLSAHRLPIVIGPIGEEPCTKPRTKAPSRLSRKAPLISVLVPVWRTPLWALQRSIGSVLAQNFADWQLCICDDASGDEELSSYLRSLSRLDRRISVTVLSENGGISLATNAALTLARGQFVAFLDHDDELTADALRVVAETIAANPEADVLYSDEDKIDASGERFDPALKPEWSPDLLLSFAYLCHLTVVRRELVESLGGLRSDFDGSQDYDLSLRATEKARQIVHIPRVLYHWRTLPGSAASDSPGTIAKPWAYEAGHRAIEDALARRGQHGEVTALDGYPGRYHVRRSVTGNPLVSMIIPFRDEPALLATCASSLRAEPGYDRIELILVDNGSALPETEALLERLGAEDNVKIIRAPGPFNWAAINNAATAEASGDVLLFANNDIEARVPRWLEALLGHALRPEVGAVGARLVYPDGAIQHAGVVIGLGGIAGHVLRGLPGDRPGYNSMAIQTRNCSVVTGACMMTRRDVFESVGGFDEDLPVAFNDVDYCLKLRTQDYLVVYTPLAELVHHESRSRGHTDDLSESKLILRRWAKEIATGDPYMNVHLSHWRYWCPLSTAQEDERWKTYLKTSVLTPRSSSNT